MVYFWPILLILVVCWESCLPANATSFWCQTIGGIRDAGIKIPDYKTKEYFSALIHKFEDVPLDFEQSILPFLNSYSKEDLDYLLKEISVEFYALNGRDPRFYRKSSRIDQWNSVIMMAYRKYIPQYTTIDELFENGILRVNEQGFVVSDYAFQGNKLNVLALESRANGNFRVLANRGTLYSSGSGKEGILTAIGYSGSEYPRNYITQNIKNEFDVVVGYPVSVAEKSYGGSVAEVHEIVIDTRHLRASEESSKVFSFSLDCSSLTCERMELEKYCLKHGCKIAKSNY